MTFTNYPSRLRGALVATAIGLPCGVVPMIAPYMLGRLGWRPYQIIPAVLVLLALCSIVAGLCLRSVIVRAYTFERVVLAAPALYWYVYMCIGTVLHGDSTGDTPMWVVFVFVHVAAFVACALSWPLTALAFTLWNPPHSVGPGEPTCLRCGYCLVGNTSGVCPECGTSVAPAKREPPA